MNMLSSTKMMAATVFAVAVDKGWLKYNDNVSKHWPEFAQNGKEHITIADVLRHDAGLNSFDSTISHVDHMDHENRNGNNAKMMYFSLRSPTKSLVFTASYRISFSINIIILVQYFLLLECLTSYGCVMLSRNDCLRP